MEQEQLTPTALKEAADISIGYASMILSGDRSPGLSVALKIYRKTGRKFGPIATATDDEINMMEELQARNAKRIQAAA